VPFLEFQPQRHHVRHHLRLRQGFGQVGSILYHFGDILNTGRVICGPLIILKPLLHLPYAWLHPEFLCNPGLNLLPFPALVPLRNSFSSNILTVTPSHATYTGVCQFKEPKTTHSRCRVAMTPKLALFLSEYRAEREWLYQQLGKHLTLDDLVLPVRKRSR